MSKIRMTTQTNYLVIWRARGDEPTVDRLRVIDAFSTSGGIEHARRTARDNAIGYRKDHGPGEIRVVVAGPALTV